MIFYDTSSSQFPSNIILNIKTLPLTRANIPKLRDNSKMYRNQFAYRSRFSELNQTKDDIYFFAKYNSLFKIRNPVSKMNDMIEKMVHPDNYSFKV
jgi:hypothetical protein